MDSVLVANSDIKELQKIRKLLGKDFNVLGMNAPKRLAEFLERSDLLLLDHNFTEDSGIEFLTKVLARFHLPVLVLTSPEQPDFAIEAMRLGAHNYIVKTDNYHEVLKHSIREAIDKFNEQEELKQTIVALKERVAELEEALKAQSKEEPKDVKESHKEAVSSKKEETSILDIITSRLRQGEINLPSYPQINIKFRQMTNQGANIKEISELLKKDIGISSKLISMSNSAYYRGVTENKTLEQAVGRLGLYETKNCVEMISNRSLYVTSNKKYNRLLENLWEHSLSCAYASEITSKLLKIKTGDEIFTMALLHDIGRLVLIQIVAELEAKGVFGKGADSTELLSTLNANHGRFGAALLKKWNFSEIHSQISLGHDSLGQVNGASKELLMIHLANLLVKTMGYGQEQPEEIDVEHANSAKFLKMTTAMITEVKDKTKKIMENATSL